SAFWDEFQRLRLPVLDDHLVLAMERNPTEGQAAIEYLSTGHQRWAAQSAQIELDARGLERCTDVSAISHSHRGLAAGDLEGPASALLRSFSRVSRDVEAALQQESVYNRRLALDNVEDRLDGLLRELTRSDEPYAARFRPIATQWRQIVADHVRELAGAVEARQEIDNPYIIGVPLTEMQEIFVGRTGVSARIEQLLLDRRRPPLLLYGQRRMGKTSLLINLGRLLPSTIIPLFVDLQGPATRASNHAGFLYNIARGMINSAQRQRDLSLPPLPRETLTGDPFTRFDEWLDEVEETLGQSTALLALDEFEALDGALAEGRFDETAVLGTLRHLIQHRPRFKVLLAGSHTLDELQRWSSYLINVQVVHIGYLKQDETRQLVEQPVKDFALRYEPEACQRVIDLTRGHPALVQLLCAEIVALKNEQPPNVRRLASLDDVEAAAPEALGHGSFFFADIERNQVNTVELALLRFLAAQGEGAVTGR
ncbi:MAG: ATP-binding protein, partial [Delftia sp.]|nr:ATP-binding protein [Delftia sp.]